MGFTYAPLNKRLASETELPYLFLCREKGWGHGVCYIFFLLFPLVYLHAMMNLVTLREANHEMAQKNDIIYVSFLAE